MSKHTPGPWSLVVNSDPRGQPSPFYRGTVALIEKGDRHITVVSDGRTVELEEWEPNGHIIAAAPELLAELKDAREHLYLEGYLRQVEAIDALIAKAEGRS